MFKYFAFGLNVSSKLILPELVPTNFDEPDVTITFGSTPSEIDNDLLPHRPLLSINASQYLHKLPIATYFVESGNQITITPNNEADEDSIRLFLYSNAFSAILHQRSFLCLHTSAILVNNHVVLIGGERGAGKSTTLMSLLQKGYAFFSDDVCVLTQNPNNELYNYVISSYPSIKLWKDSFEKLQLHFDSSIKQLRPDFPKFRFPIELQELSGAYPIAAIILLDKDSSITKPQITQLTPLLAMERIGELLYRKAQVDALYAKTVLFKKYTDLLNACPFFVLKRPSEGNYIDAVVHLIENSVIN